MLHGTSGRLRRCRARKLWTWACLATLTLSVRLGDYQGSLEQPTWQSPRATIWLAPEVRARRVLSLTRRRERKPGPFAASSRLGASVLSREHGVSTSTAGSAIRVLADEAKLTTVMAGDIRQWLRTARTNPDQPWVLTAPDQPWVLTAQSQRW